MNTLLIRILTVSDTRRIFKHAGKAYKARGSMTRRTGRASHIAIKGPRSGSTEAPMRKPLRHGRRFAAGRRVIGKISRVAEQTGSGKGVWETAVVPAAAKAALETEGGQESRVDCATGQVGRVTGQHSAVASGALGEAESQRWWRTSVSLVLLCV